MEIKDKVAPVAQSPNFTAINVGGFDDLAQYSLIHPKSGKTVEGKFFLQNSLHTTGVEISFNTLPPNAFVGYFHKHREIEEVYIVLKGQGRFQVDDDVFDISEGSIVRVAPDGCRALTNTSNDSPLIYQVIQSKKDSIQQHTSDDGYRLEHENMMI